MSPTTVRVINITAYEARAIARAIDAITDPESVDLVDKARVFSGLHRLLAKYDEAGAGISTHEWRGK